jgi:hypothetical protein
MGSCSHCHCQQRVKVSKEEHDNYNAGMLIQDALHSTDENDREWLISGICGTCFDKLFPDE